MRVVLMLAASIAIVGCVSQTTPLNESRTYYFADLSSGSVGCAPGEIEISDLRGDGPRRTWTATCRGQTHYCTSLVFTNSLHFDCTRAAE